MEGLITDDLLRIRNEINSFPWTTFHTTYLCFIFKNESFASKNFVALLSFGMPLMLLSNLEKETLPFFSASMKHF